MKLAALALAILCLALTAALSIERRKNEALVRIVDTANAQSITAASVGHRHSIATREIEQAGERLTNSVDIYAIGARVALTNPVPAWPIDLPTSGVVSTNSP